MRHLDLHARAMRQLRKYVPAASSLLQLIGGLRCANPPYGLTHHKA
jgi:hypothetical protein